ncbi:hypothetical protein BGX21_002068 [Mortierella sp. AD011]|nr:hypothetical protein BGX20_005106 [Mortierella sp. AD010]KAF9401311.1 hypothetical protein BGX21_002068 [Mortierella sp. AD011]
MSGMSAQLCHTGPNPLDSSQSPDSWENLHSKRSLQQQQQHREQNEKQLKQQKQQHREQNEKQLKQQKKHQQQQHIQNDQQQNDQQQNDQQQQTQQQNLKEDLRTVDSFAAHYSTSHDRIIRPSPISYHHFKPSPEVVHGPRHRRPKSPKIVNLNLPQSESQISQQDSSSSSLPLIDPPSNPSSSSTSCALSPSSSQYLPPETSNSLHSFITHPRGTVTQVDFPLHQASEIPEKSSQNTLGTSRPTSPLSTTCELLPQGSPYAAATSILNPTVGTKPSLASHQIDTIEILNEEESQDDAQSPSPAASYLISQPAPFLRSSIPTECQNRSHSQCASETIPEPATGPRHPATLPPVSPLGSSSILDAVLAAGDGNGNGASADATVANSGASMNTRTNMNTSSNITSVSNFSFTTISSYPVSLSLNTGMEWESETANAGPYATLSVETTATSNEDRQARSRSFGQRLRDTFWFKSKKRKQH